MQDLIASGARTPARAEFQAHWLSLLGCSLGAGCGLGLYTSVSSVFFRALEHEFHWSKAASAASLLAYPVTALSLPLVGRLLDTLSPTQAALMISLLSISVIPSRLIVGWALDVVDPRLAGGAAFLLAAAGALVVLFSPFGAVGVFSLGVLLMGTAFGAEFDLMSYFCAHCFGLKNYAAIYGLIMSFFYLGFASGGIGYGTVHDLAGSYVISLAASAVLMLLACALLLPLPRRPLEIGAVARA